MIYLVLFWVLSTLFSNTWPWPTNDAEWKRWCSSATSVLLGYGLAFLVLICFVAST